MTPTNTLNQRIPRFNTVEEEAAFWDSHSTADFEVQWLSVQAEVANPLGRRYVLSIELDESEFQALREVARDQGTSASELVKQWIAERLPSDHSSRVNAENGRP